jgi:hypothetical protein
MPSIINRGTLAIHFPVLYTVFNVQHEIVYYEIA